jgi:hypothetical protein
MGQERCPCESAGGWGGGENLEPSCRIVGRVPPRGGSFNLKAAVGLSTDFTDFTDGRGQEASPLRRFHFTRRVKRQPFPTGFKSVESAICGSNCLFQVQQRRVRAPGLPLELSSHFLETGSSSGRHYSPRGVPGSVAACNGFPPWCGSTGRTGPAWSWLWHWLLA